MRDSGGTSFSASVLGRFGQGRLLGVQLAFALLGLIGPIVVGEASEAAQIIATSSSSPGPVLVGEVIEVRIALVASGSEGPGTVSVELQWAPEREEQAPYGLGALTLQALPSIASPALSVVTSDDCMGSVGSPSGRCRLDFTFDAPVPEGVRSLARFDFVYGWVSAPGWEICSLSDTDPSCQAAEQTTGIRTSAIVFGSPAPPTSALSFGTSALIGVRPIPEPATAMLVGLGLGLLALRRGRAPARPDRR